MQPEKFKVPFDAKIVARLVFFLCEYLHLIIIW